MLDHPTTKKKVRNILQEFKQSDFKKSLFCPAPANTGRVRWHGHPCWVLNFSYTYSLPVILTRVVSCDTGAHVSYCSLPLSHPCQHFSNTGRIRWHGRPCQLLQFSSISSVLAFFDTGTRVSYCISGGNASELVSFTSILVQFRPDLKIQKPPDQDFKSTLFKQNLN